MLFDILAQQQVDLVVLGGDIFDNPKPTLPELKLFYESIAKFTVPVKIISGNHEAIDKRLYTYDYIPEVGYTYCDKEIIEVGKTHVVLCGHKNLKSLFEVIHNLKDKKTILFTHIRCTVPPYIKEEFPTKILSEKFDLVISGDIHYPYAPHDNFRYSGTPYGLKYTTNVSHGYFIVCTDTLGVEYRELNLPNRLKLECKASELHKLKLNNTDKFKIKVVGSIEELQALELPRFNVVYEKNIISQETTEQVTIVDGKISVLDTLKEHTKEMFGLSEKIMDIGDGVLVDVMSRYKGT